MKRTSWSGGSVRVLLVGLAFGLAASAAEAEWDVTVYGGVSLPTYEQRLEFSLPSIPNNPNIDVTPRGNFVLTGKGGPVFGAALAFEMGGFFALEGRFDTATLKLDTGGIGYDIRVHLPPPGGTYSGALVLGAGTFELDRFRIYSANLRLRTPDPVSLFFSAGVSYMGKLSTSGTIPASLEIEGVPIDAGVAARLSLVASPVQEEYRWGANAGLGVRVRLTDSISIMGEARAFGFREYELEFQVATTPSLPVLDDIVDGFETVKFPPVYFHGAVGLVLTF